MLLGLVETVPVVLLALVVPAVLVVVVVVVVVVLVLVVQMSRLTRGRCLEARRQQALVHVRTGKRVVLGVLRPNGSGWAKVRGSGPMQLTTTYGI